MGLAETVRALISVKADTSQAKAEIKGLRATERDAAVSRLKELEDTNRGIDRQIAMFGKLTMGIGAIVGVAAIAKKAMGDYLEDVRLESAAAGTNIEALRKATSGLVAEDNLLAFAGKTANGVWKLNQAEMERVLQGAMALRKTMGTELTPTVDALTEAITKGNTRALKEFGIEAKSKEDVLRALDERYASLGGNVKMAGDEMVKADTSMKDAVDDLSGSLGELALALTPVIGLLASATSLITDSIEGWKILFRGGNTSLISPEMQGQALDIEIAEKLAFFEKQNAEMDAKYARLIRNKDATRPFDTYAREASDRAKLRGKGKRGGGGYQLNFAEAEGVIYGDTDYGSVSALMAEQAMMTDSSGLERDTIGMDNESVKGDLIRSKTKAIRELTDAMDQLKTQDFGKELASIFGATTSIDVQAEAVGALAASYSVLADAGGDAYEALVTGSMSATEAMKKALANGLLAMGRDFFVRALGETAMGIASLALGPIGGPSAGQHFAAAAAFGGAAAAAGVAARAMGAGSGGGKGASASAGTGGSRAPSLGMSGGGGGDVNRNVTVIIGDSFDNMTASERHMRMARAVKMGMNSTSSTTIRDG
jgi:hypothetical protein